MKAINFCIIYFKKFSKFYALKGDVLLAKMNIASKIYFSDFQEIAYEIKLINPGVLNLIEYLNGMF
jgi:penicillin-binding protein-related factor A (putative recombinase)